MGFKPSPYLAIQGARYAQDFAMGDMSSRENVFRWHRVRINLPGDPIYDPLWPWVSKVRENGDLAANIFQYVDNVQLTNTDKECWGALHTYGSWINHLGLQYAARKIRPLSQLLGPWAGSMVETDNEKVTLLITQEK